MKVSVVIPTYNRGHLITSALDSVLNQSYQNLEIIVVSDGSTDDTDNIIEKYQKSDSRVKYISYYPNKGGNYARNKGIKEAKGKYIAFLDDDDQWSPEKVELQMKKFKSNSEVGLVYTGVEIHYVDKGLSYISKPEKTGDLSTDILISNYIGTTSSVIVKSELLDKSGFFDENLKALQDYDLWIRICQNTIIDSVKKPLLKYNNTSAEQISDSTKKYEKAINYINNKYSNLYKKVSKDIRAQHRSAMNLLLANKALRNGDKKSARNYLKHCLKDNKEIKILLLYVLSYFNYNIILRVKSIIS